MGESSTEIGQAAGARIAERAAEIMKHEISLVGGREVFFAGTIDEKGIVVNARPCARGTEGAVPALFEGIAPRDVVIHNHPSGNIAPSDPDLELAITYSHNGHGVYIVDNEISRVYVVIEPFIDKEVHRLNEEELGGILAPNSPIAQRLRDYEIRPQQAEMMGAVAQAFNENGIAVIEAPTGVGKTLAYLVPAIQWAVRNRERVVISTRTINLQEQIVFKDVPLIASALDEPFTAVLVKGRQNYLCPQRLQRALSEATLFDDKKTQTSLKSIAEWAERTEDGSKSDLPFVPVREVWEKVCSESDTCTAALCQASNNCFVSKARREMAKADILVVNHYMLFSDLSIKKNLGNFNALAVLPAYDRLILDEAHHIEESATEYFGTDCTRLGALMLIGRLSRMERGQDRGLLTYVKLQAMKASKTASQPDIEELLDIIDQTILPSIAVCRNGLDSAFHSVRELTAAKCGQIGRDVKWRLTQEVLYDPELRELHTSQMVPTSIDVSSLAKHCGELLVILKRIRGSDTGEEKPFDLEIAQLQAYRERLVRLASVLAAGTQEELVPNTVRWIEIDERNANIVRIISCPLEVGKPMAEWVYSNLKTVVMTSATLTIENSFDFLFRRIGLDLVEDNMPNCLQLETPFDFESQALLLLPKDMPEPNDRRFNDACAAMTDEILAATQGHALLLFTSFMAMNDVHRRLSDTLRNRGIECLKQGDAGRTQLLDQFRENSSSVLFATDSFWEGIDVAGESLQCVILPKLPFRVPTEPVFQARAETIEASGGNSFMEYTVPLAVIKFRQGVGRLIRRRSDRGSVVLLDPRLQTKRYGRIFLESLPPFKMVSGPSKGVMAALQRFHQEEDAS